MTRFIERLRSVGQACKKCGAAADEYCRHSNESRPKFAQYKRFEISEQSAKAIETWLKGIMKE